MRLDAYYDLGTLGAEGVPVLMAALKDESARRWQANLKRGDFTNPSQLESPYGLAAAGAVAVPALVEALQGRDWWLRAGAATALGCMGAEAQGAATALSCGVAGRQRMGLPQCRRLLGQYGPGTGGSTSSSTGPRR